MVKGKYISGGSSEILLGEDLADLLEAELGDRLVITLAQVDGGELSQGLFRLSGIFRFGMRELDNNLVFISLDRSRELLGMSHGAHEVAIKFIDQDIPNRPDLPLFKKLAADNNEAQGWREFMPQINAMIEMVDYSTLIVGVILFLLAALGVINSMFMSIYERIYEFGVAKAIGTRPRQLVQLILMEAFVLGVFSIIFGILLGGSATWYWSIHGLPFGEYHMSGISLVEPIKSVITWQQFTYFPIYVLLLIMVASLYPARFAAKINPSQALQRTL
jgi:ABC-type lipoprotein release transport system permease subunit